MASSVKIGDIVHYQPSEGVLFPAMVVAVVDSAKAHLAVFTPRGNWHKQAAEGTGDGTWRLPGKEKNK